MGKEGPFDPRNYDSYWNRFAGTLVNAVDKPATWIRGENLDHILTFRYQGLNFNWG